MVSLSLGKSLEGLVHVGAHGDLCDIDVAVGHGDLRKILLADSLSCRRELRDLTDVGGL